MMTILMTILITIGSQTFTAEIEDTPTGRDFVAMLPLTIEMEELNGNEKYAYGYSMTRNDSYFSSLSAGDLMLYSGNCIVLFYGNAGGYSYTRIGRITNPQGLAAAVGSGDVTVTFSATTTDIQSATSSRPATKRIVDGKVMVSDYTVDGKKLK